MASPQPLPASSSSSSAAPPTTPRVRRVPKRLRDADDDNNSSPLSPAELKYSGMNERLATFNNVACSAWPKTEAMAAAGFIYEGASPHCFICKIQIQEWKPTD